MPIRNVREIDTYPGEAYLSKLFLPLSVLEWIRFQKGNGVQESKQENSKAVSCPGEYAPSVSIDLKSICKVKFVSSIVP